MPSIPLQIQLARAGLEAPVTGPDCHPAESDGGEKVHIDKAEPLAHQTMGFDENQHFGIIGFWQLAQTAQEIENFIAIVDPAGRPTRR